MISYNQFQWLTTIDNIIVAGNYSNKGLLYSKNNKFIYSKYNNFSNEEKDYYRIIKEIENILAKCFLNILILVLK